MDSLGNEQQQTNSSCARNCRPATPAGLRREGARPSIQATRSVSTSRKRNGPRARAALLCSSTSAPAVPPASVPRKARCTTIAPSGPPAPSSGCSFIFHNWKSSSDSSSISLHRCNRLQAWLCADSSMPSEQASGRRRTRRTRWASGSTNSVRSMSRIAGGAADCEC